MARDRDYDDIPTIDVRDHAHAQRSSRPSSTLRPSRSIRRMHARHYNDGWLRCGLLRTSTIRVSHKSQRALDRSTCATPLTYCLTLQYPTCTTARSAAATHSLLYLRSRDGITIQRASGTGRCRSQEHGSSMATSKVRVPFLSRAYDQNTS